MVWKKTDYEPPKMDGFETSSATGTSSMANISDLWTRIDYIAIPAGMVATSCALAYGLLGMSRSNSSHQNLGMRLRVGFQGFTLGALLIAGFIGGRREVMRMRKQTEEAKRAKEEKAAIKAAKMSKRTVTETA